MECGYFVWKSPRNYTISEYEAKERLSLLLSHGPKVAVWKPIKLFRPTLRGLYPLASPLSKLMGGNFGRRIILMRAQRFTLLCQFMRRPK